jgi:CTP synthase (UTP-ammonia lyase)
VYASGSATEKYYCRFGLNPDYIPALVQHGLRISGTDAEGEPRIVELPDNRFFVATLFVPQTASQADRPHPLVSAFLRAAS